MSIDEINKLWEVDSNIDITELGDELIRIPSLHHKYFTILTKERLLYRKFDAEMKALRLAKQEFFTQGPTKETHEKGWELPAMGKILKSEVSYYIEADKDIIELSLKIGMQLEKISFLEDIIKTLHNRGYNLKTILDWEKFKLGN